MTPRRAKFVCEYLRDFNGTQAAIRAGYSPRTANEQAARLLAQASVGDAVRAAAAATRSAAILTLTEAQEIATTIAREAGAPRRDRLAAIDRMAKFNAWDAAAKVDVTSGGKPLRTELVITGTVATAIEDTSDTDG
jgi:phage terminase small subunit